MLDKNEFLDSIKVILRMIANGRLKIEQQDKQAHSGNKQGENVDETPVESSSSSSKKSNLT